MTPVVRYLCYTDKLFTRIYATRKKNIPRDSREDKSEKTSYMKKREKCVDDTEFAYQSAKYQRVYIRQIPNMQSLVICVRRNTLDPVCNSLYKVIDLFSKSIRGDQDVSGDH